MKRIIIIGSPGTGKSTLGRILQNKLNITLYHLDKLLWKPHWEMSSIEEQCNLQYELVKKESWIIDGNYGSTLDIRLTYADTIIYLKRSRVVCIMHIFKRIWKYKGHTRPDMQDDCPERLDISFIKWIWEFPKKQTPLIESRLQHLNEQQTLIILENSNQINEFIQKIENGR